MPPPASRRRGQYRVGATSRARLGSGGAAAGPPRRTSRGRHPEGPGDGCTPTLMEPAASARFSSSMYRTCGPVGFQNWPMGCDQRFQAAGSYSLTLVCVSSYHRVGGGCHAGGEGPEELARDVALETAFDLTDRLAFGSASGDIGLGSGAVAHSDRSDRVDGTVEGAIAAAVEAVAHGAPAAGRYRAGSGEGGKRGVVAAAAGVRERHDGLGGGDGSDPGALGEAGS